MLAASLGLVLVGDVLVEKKIARWRVRRSRHGGVVSEGVGRARQPVVPVSDKRHTGMAGHCACRSGLCEL